jgi:hypothetical protein
MEKCAYTVGMRSTAKTIGKYSIYILFLLCCLALYAVYSSREVAGFQGQMPTLVHSRGILASCDIHPTDPSSSTSDLRIDVSGIKEGSTVYICSAAIKGLVAILDTIPHRFVLVTGDSDESIPDTVFSTHEEFLRCIESDKILHWFTQNCTGSHPKLTAIPIGLDYHTLAAGAMGWGPQQPPTEQERELLQVRSAAPLLSERKLLCYATFHFNKQVGRRYTYDREDAIQGIPKDLVVYEPKEIPRLDTWKHQAEHAFVVSPHGNGLDCHRTWEALSLGCIPIVKKSPVDAIYEGLPVLIVGEWTDVTQELLSETLEKFKGQAPDYKQLTLDYWMDKIRSKSSLTDIDGL